MANSRLSESLHKLFRTFRARSCEGIGDQQLLESFVSAGDEAAFEAVLRRYGPMVLALCRRVLRDPHDVEDAFQATFLVLIRKAGQISKPHLLGNWLYGVACRVALEARAHSARWRAYQREYPHVASAETVNEDVWRDLRPILDEEISRLPDKYRLPVFLCYLQGKTNKEAAEQLGYPSGSMAKRLTRAREILRERLASRGVTLSMAMLAGVLSTKLAPAAALPAMLLGSTMRMAVLFATGEAATVGAVSTTVATLAKGAVRGMFLTKMKVMGAVVLTVGMIGSGAGLLAHQAAGLKQTGTGPRHFQRTSVGEPQLSEKNGDPKPAKQPSSPKPADEKSDEVVKKIMSPTRIRLVYKDAPVPDAIADFEKKTGFRIIVTVTPKLKARKITLDTGETTFWEAFDQLCEKASLVQIMTMNMSALVMDGNPTRIPIHYAGAFRVKLLQRGAEGLGAPGEGEILLPLEIVGEPKNRWVHSLKVQIEKAVDENGQKLLPVDHDWPLRGTHLNQFPVVFKNGGKPAKLLKDLRGTLKIRVHTAPEPVMTVSDILKAAKTTVRCADGGSLTVLDSSCDKNGDFRIKVELVPPANVVAGFSAGVQPPPGAVPSPGAAGEKGKAAKLPVPTSARGLALVDDKGYGFKLLEFTNGFDPATKKTTASLRFRAHNGQGDPVKLIFAGERDVTLDVPFTLKDVPLP